MASDSSESADLSLPRLLLLTLSLAGIQFAWTVEFAFGTPFLLSLGLPKSLAALVWIAGPLSGLLVQPLVGVWSDTSRSKWGKRRPFMLAAGVLVVVSIALIAYCEDISALVYPLDLDSFNSSSVPSNSSSTNSTFNQNETNIFPHSSPLSNSSFQSTNISTDALQVPNYITISIAVFAFYLLDFSINGTVILIRCHGDMQGFDCRCCASRTAGCC